MNDLLARFERLRRRHLDDVLALISETIARETPDGSSLVDMATYHMQTGGKRLRALLPLAVADALGRDPADVVAFAAACELLHNATLVHDDLQDGDTTRRGEETVWVRYGAPRAINLGDALLYYTLLLARQVPFDAEARERLALRIARETIRVIDGQEREFLLQDDLTASVADYTRMVEGKTSGLFALPMAATAELCGAEPSVVKGLASAAGHLGVLFQIQDDVLDLYADKGRGQVGSDLGEGKMSILAVHCLEHADEPDARWLFDVLRRDREDVTEGDVARAAELFRTSGSLDFALDEIGRRAEQSVVVAALAGHDRLQELVRSIAELFVTPISEVST